MSGMNIFILTVLINVNLIQTEVIKHEVDTAKVLGKWFFVAGPPSDRYIGCITIIVEQQSEDTVKVTPNIIMTPEGIKLNQTYTEELELFLISCTIARNSSIFTCRNMMGSSLALLVFEINYDSYMAVRFADSEEDITGPGGVFALFGRDTKLPNEIIDRIRASTYYRDHKLHELVVFNPVKC